MSETIDRLTNDGYLILERVLDQQALDGIRSALEPHLASGPFGRNPFEGRKTQRVYGLLQKSRVFDPLVEHPVVMEACEEVLGPGFLLSVAHAIQIHPGESPQALHHDDAFYPGPRPRDPLGVSTIWAIDEFTPDNGATLIVPKSHTWPESSRELPEGLEPEPVVMPAGSLLLFLGTLYHGGGENTGDSTRLGLTIQYCPAWARQQESFLLGVRGQVAQQLSLKVQELIGYSIHPPFMGHVDGRHPTKVWDEAED